MMLPSRNRGLAVGWPQKMISESLRGARIDADLHVRRGSVLGIDVGWSIKKPTTGLCLIEWTNEEISLRRSLVSPDNVDQLTKLNELIEQRSLLAVAIDGPLAPEFRIISDYRAAEALLSRGKFQRRGKPGPVNGGSGPQLHKEATKWARLVLKTQVVAPAKYPHKIHKNAVVEAFPNAFLSVLHPDDSFPAKPRVSRRWTDTLFPRVKGRLGELLKALLPERQVHFDFNSIHGHEDIASFVCALTALCVSTRRGIAVGSRDSGYIVLPPLEFWGESSESSSKWAIDVLGHNRSSVSRQFSFQLFRDCKKWTLASEPAN